MFPCGSVVKNLPANAGKAGESGSVPGSERSPGQLTFFRPLYVPVFVIIKCFTSILNLYNDSEGNSITPNGMEWELRRIKPMGGGRGRDSPWAPWGRDSSQTSRAPLLVRKPSLHHAPGPFHAPPRALLTPPPISHPSLVSSASLHWVLPCPQM